MNRLLFLALTAAVGLSACSKKEEAAAPAAAPAAAAAQASSSPGSASPNSGKVVQSLQAGGYTYAEVDTGGQKIWVAGAPIEVKPGDTVQWGDYAVMQNFTSKTLNRTFDQILFVNAWGPAGGASVQMAPHGNMPAPGAAMAPAGQTAQAAAPSSNEGEVKSVMNASGYTYLEVKQGGATVWIAAPETQVKVGDKVRWANGSVMQNFTSKTLNRTFDSIVFANQVAVVQ